MKKYKKTMLHTTHSLRVRYAETDPMKYVYYGNYAQYLEVARVELFRSIGMSYNEIESRGVWLPVSTFEIQYLKPGFYDDLLKIDTYVRKIPGVKIEFDYEIFNSQGEKITTAKTVLFFFSAEEKKVIKCPDFLMELIQPYFDKTSE